MAVNSRRKRRRRILALIAAAAVALVVGLRMSGAPPRVVRASWVMIAALGVQGVIGYIQYFTHLPAGLVWVHVTGAVLVWIAVLRLFLLMRERGPLTRPSPEPVQAAPYRQPAAGGQGGRPPRATLPLDR